MDERAEAIKPKERERLKGAARRRVARHASKPDPDGPPTAGAFYAFSRYPCVTRRRGRRGRSRGASRSDRPIRARRRGQSRVLRARRPLRLGARRGEDRACEVGRATSANLAPARTGGFLVGYLKERTGGRSNGAAQHNPLEANETSLLVRLQALSGNGGMPGAVLRGDRGRAMEAHGTPCLGRSPRRPCRVDR